MAHNVLSYGSPEAARRANRAINKVAQDGGFVGVKPTERRVHTAVATENNDTETEVLCRVASVLGDGVYSVLLYDETLGQFTSKAGMMTLPVVWVRAPLKEDTVLFCKKRMVKVVG